jgi:hypothetical protein
MSQQPRSALASGTSAGQFFGVRYSNGQGTQANGKPAPTGVGETHSGVAYNRAYGSGTQSVSSLAHAIGQMSVQRKNKSRKNKSRKNKSRKSRK